jgi:hypothetical protein
MAVSFVIKVPPTLAMVISSPLRSACSAVKPLLCAMQRCRPRSSDVMGLPARDNLPACDK